MLFKYKGNIAMTEQYISDEEFDDLSEKEQVKVLINMIKDAPRDELILLKNTLDEISLTKTGN